MPTQFDFGFLAGLLVGEGHFGGDGRQPHVTLRMHVRHEAIFRWLERTFPGGRVYGPYNHGGRHYLQWMARGPFLRDELVPMLDQFLSPSLDRHSFDRYELMKARYPQLASGLAAPGDPVSAHSGRPRRAASRPAVRRTASNPASTDRPTTSAARADDHPDSARTAPTAEASDYRGTADARPTADPATFDELFDRLRETWPP